MFIPFECLPEVAPTAMLSNWSEFDTVAKKSLQDSLWQHSVFHKSEGKPEEAKQTPVKRCKTLTLEPGKIVSSTNGPQWKYKMLCPESTLIWQNKHVR